MMRTFVGLEVPEDIGRMLVAAQSGLRLGRLVDRENDTFRHEANRTVSWQSVVQVSDAIFSLQVQLSECSQGDLNQFEILDWLA